MLANHGHPRFLVGQDLAFPGAISGALLYAVPSQLARLPASLTGNDRPRFVERTSRTFPRAESGTVLDGGWRKPALLAAHDAGDPRLLVGPAALLAAVLSALSYARRYTEPRPAPDTRHFLTRSLRLRMAGARAVSAPLRHNTRGKHHGLTAMLTGEGHPPGILSRHYIIIARSRARRQH